ncbi:MAG: ABC transporter permease [Candidatus Puniceispirillaceae bacterium]|nr:ABC transporter permease [Pseudomonadota bacterium]
MAEFWTRYRRNRAAVLGLGILFTILFMAATAHLFYPEDPFRLVGRPLSGPFENGFLLGSDSLGRDVASGIVHGAKTSLLIGLIATLVSIFIGIFFGAFAGYFGGRVDDLLMRITEIFQTIPSFIFAILLVAIMKPSIFSIVIAIAVVSWPGVARLVRGEFLSLKNREFVQACHTIGMSDLRVMLREILPNCLSPIIVIGSLMVATAILIESGLAFLGLGDPNIMSWGFQIGAGRTMLRSAWWVCTFPGIAILITVLAINLIGEGLNDALNPRLKERQ